MSALLLGALERRAAATAASEEDALRREEALSDEDHTKTEGGGGAKKVLLLTLPVLAAGGGAGAYYATHQNRAPSGGTIGVSSPLALMAVTEVEFSSQGASDPDGDGLSYEWDFGDGSSGTGEVVRHVFATAGTFTVTLSVGDGERHAPAAPVEVTVKSVSGNWKADSSWSPLLKLNQEAALLSGSYSDSAGGGALLPGSQVEAPATLVVKVGIASGASSWRATLTCALDAVYDECLGRFVDDKNGRDYGIFRFTRQ